jgi:hypothetical protein
MTTELYCVEPIGLGTPACEALSSVLTRLAREHRVSPRDLVREVLGRDPTVRRLNYARFFDIYAATINGHGCYAEAFVAALGRASGASHLASATLLPWRSLFARNGHPLMSPKRRWCSACWAETISKGHPPYDFLLWSLAQPVRCPWHGALLADACPNCQKPQPIIPRSPLLTHCDHCGRPLSTKLKPMRPLAASDSAWLCADFIRISPSVAEHDLAKHLRETLTSIIKVDADGNRAAFCRLAGMHPFALKNLFAKQERPSLQFVLRLLQAIDLWPSEVFAQAIPPRSGVKATSPSKRPESRRRLSSSDRCLVPPLWLIAQDLQVSRSHFKRKYPTEFALASRARRAFVLAEREELDRLRTQFARRAVDVLSSSGSIGRKRLETHLREAGLSLRSPALFDAVQSHLLLRFLTARDERQGKWRQS